MNVTLTVNGTSRTVEVEPRTTLLDCLRDNLGLTGAHAGCERRGMRCLHGAARRHGGALVR